MATETPIEIQRQQNFAVAAVTKAIKPIISWFIQLERFPETVIHATTTTSTQTQPKNNSNNSSTVRCRLRTVPENNETALDYQKDESSQNTPTTTEWNTVKFTELPDWLQDNQYILSGYRPQLTFQDTLKSLFRIHSETVNIWTHFLGFFIYLFIIVQFLVDDELGVTWSDKKWIAGSMTGYLATLVFSATYHLLHCYTKRVYRWCIRLDYIGIHLASICLCMSWMHYTFKCHRHLELMYVAAVWLAAPFCTALGLFERFAHPELRAVRAAALGALGCIGHIGGLHYASFYVTYEQMLTEGVHYVFLAAITMYIGGALFATQFPECCKPGMFDVWGASHQLLHMCVLLAGYFHFTGLKQIALYRLSQGCTFFGQPLPT